VLGPTERLQYTGNVQGTFEYLMGTLLVPLIGPKETWFSGRSSDPIKDPTNVAVKNLLRLAGTGDGPRRWREAEEVRHFARYAAVCPAGLARERALLELAPHGRRLQLAGPYRRPAVPASAEELRVRLAGLIDGAQSLASKGGSAPATALADFQSACKVLAEAEVDIAGGRRVLRAIAPFLRRTGLRAEAAASLTALSEGIQRRLVAEALAIGLEDPLPYVRAAAVRSCTEVYGDVFLLEAAFVLGVRPVQPVLPGAFGAEFTAFGLRPDPPEVEEMRVEICRLLSTRGLPAPARTADARGLTLRWGVYAALTQVATRYEIFESRARAQAMLALDVVSGAGLGSLREEVWQDWWSEVDPELRSLMTSEQERERKATPPAS